MSKRGLVEAALVLGVLWGLVRLAEVAPAAQGEPGAYARYGFDRLSFDWNPENISVDFCVPEEQGGKGFFCDGTQLAISSLKSLQDYLEFAQAVINNPPEPVQEIVNKEFASKTQENIYNFSRITKEQVLLKGAPFVDISGALIKPKHNYFVNREQDPGSLLLLEAKRKEPDCGMDLTEIEEKVIEAVQSTNTILQAKRANLNVFNTYIPECYDFEEGEFDGELDVLVILREKFFKGIEKESNRLNFIDLKKEGLVPANDDRLVAMTFKAFIEDLGKGFPGSVLIELVGKNTPTIAVYYEDAFEESADFFVPVRNFKGIAPAQFEHARFNASVWQDASLRSVLSSHDFSKPFPFVEVPGSVTPIDDFSGSLESSFFQDLSRRYAAAFEPVFDKILGFPSVKKTGEGPGLADVRFSARLDLLGKTISLRGTALNLAPGQSLSQLDATRGTRYADNPFLALPLDGDLGLQPDGSLLRRGYGTDVSLTGDPAACPLSPAQPWRPAHPDSQALVRLEVAVPSDPRPDDPAVALTLVPLGERHFRLTCYPASRPGRPFSLQALLDELRAGELTVSIADDRSLTLRWNE